MNALGKVLRNAAIASAFVFAGAQTADTASWQGVPVLMYHLVDAHVPNDPVGRDLTVEPQTFAEQLRYLRAHHIETLTAAKLADDLAHGIHPASAVVLTFDDGYEDAATTALPILRANHAVGTFYVSSGFVGTPRHLTWNEMRALRSAGMEVACHGTMHLDLSTLDSAAQHAEAAGCMRRFARYLGGAPPRTYAYPAGQYNATTLAMMRELGMTAAFTEHPGVVRDLARPYELPRRRIRHDDTIAQFAAVATP